MTPGSPIHHDTKKTPNRAWRCGYCSGRSIWQLAPQRHFVSATIQIMDHALSIHLQLPFIWSRSPFGHWSLLHLKPWLLACINSLSIRVRFHWNIILAQARTEPPHFCADVSNLSRLSTGQTSRYRRAAGLQVCRLTKHLKSKPKT